MRDGAVNGEGNYLYITYIRKKYKNQEIQRGGEREREREREHV